MADAPSDYKVSGYGIISAGSSMKLFMGTDQQFFLGGKNAMNIGTSNTFTAGLKADVMVGPSITMSLGPKWVSDTKIVAATAKQRGHYFAKYDFSSNKTFAFQIAHEGSSTYTTQSKFFCRTGFLAVGGFQKTGDTAFEAYTQTIDKMGMLAAMTNFAMAAIQIVQTTEAPSPEKDAKGEYKGKGDLADNYTRQMFAKLTPAVFAATSAFIIGRQAILAALQREGNFKSFLHPQSVMDLGKNNVFLGAIGDTLQATQREGASLKLADGRATLGVRRVDPINKKNTSGVIFPLGTPYTEKFTDFNDKPSAALEIDSKTVTSYASRISIAAGAEIGTDPMSRQLEMTKKALQTALEVSKTAGEAAYKGIMETPFPGTEEDQQRVAGMMRDQALLATSPAIATALVAYQTALAYVDKNPTLYLTAGSKTKSPLSKIEAEAPNFNVISPSISLSDTRVPLRGLFVKQVPPSIQLVQSAVSKISMDTTGSIALAVNPSVSINLKPSSVVIQLGPNSISMKPVVTTITAGAQKIELGMGVVKIGSSLKVMGV